MLNQQNYCSWKEFLINYLPFLGVKQKSDENEWLINYLPFPGVKQKSQEVNFNKCQKETMWEFPSSIFKNI